VKSSTKIAVHNLDKNRLSRFVRSLRNNNMLRNNRTKTARRFVAFIVLTVECGKMYES